MKLFRRKKEIVYAFTVQTLIDDEWSEIGEIEFFQTEKTKDELTEIANKKMEAMIDWQKELKHNMTDIKVSVSRLS